MIIIYSSFTYQILISSTFHMLPKVLILIIPTSFEMPSRLFPRAFWKYLVQAQFKMKKLAKHCESRQFDGAHDGTKEDMLDLHLRVLCPKYDPMRKTFFWSF